MKKQTKLVAVLSTAALLAIGASMTSFAATGWAEEDGTWVYYDRNGDKVTDKWAKSGNNWYYLDNNGEMAIDTLIEDGDNYYYVDVNGVMAANQWVAIDNEDAGDDNEPEHYWYYFQANGKALKTAIQQSCLKTVNGKKYASMMKVRCCMVGLSLTMLAVSMILMVMHLKMVTTTSVAKMMVL